MGFHNSNETLDLLSARSMIAEDANSRVTKAIESEWDCEPLDPDTPDDFAITTSSRRLLRLTIAAADAGARFAREGVEVDPAAWMLTPRDLFDGLPPIEACQELEHFNRSIVLHSLALDLDADPRAIDALLMDEPLDAYVYDGAEAQRGEVRVIDERIVDLEPTEDRLSQPELLTCLVDCLQGTCRVFAFCAIVTDRPADLIERVVGRFGRNAASTATFALGFDRMTAMATALISDAMADSLELAAADPRSSLASGLDVLVEQRFVDWKLAA